MDKIRSTSNEDMVAIVHWFTKIRQSMWTALILEVVNEYVKKEEMVGKISSGTVVSLHWLYIDRVKKVFQRGLSS